MMCKHKVLAVCKVILPDSMEIKRAFCVHCGKTKTEIDIEQQLAAANARIAELEQQNKRMRELLVEIQSYAETYLDLEPRMKHIIDCAKAALEGK